MGFNYDRKEGKGLFRFYSIDRAHIWVGPILDFSCWFLECGRFSGNVLYLVLAYLKLEIWFNLL